jgi:hypothetical protein
MYKFFLSLSKIIHSPLCCVCVTRVASNVNVPVLCTYYVNGPTLLSIGFYPVQHVNSCVLTVFQVPQSHPLFYSVFPTALSLSQKQPQDPPRSFLQSCVDRILFIVLNSYDPSFSRQFTTCQCQPWKLFLFH